MTLTSRLFFLRAIPYFCFLLLSTSVSRAAPDDFVEVKKLDPTIVIDLPYATTNNFCERKLYPIERCFLRRKVAEALLNVQKDLKKEGVGLKIWDGYRPHSVQWEMWKHSPIPNFVGDPRYGSKHNRGAAVDMTLVDLKSKKELKMPTPYDEFSPRAHANYIKVSKEVAKNRALLQKAMRAHGFQTIQSEWWHFNYNGWRDFPVVDISLEELAGQQDN